MAISTLDNFDYKGKKPNFARDLFDTVADMVAFSENYLPDIFIASVIENGNTYVFNRANTIDADLGKWRRLEGAAGSPETSKTITANASIGLVKEGTTYAAGTNIEDILTDLLAGKTLEEEDFYYGVSDTRNIISLYQFDDSTTSVCTVAPNNQYVIFAAKASLGNITIQDTNGWPYNDDFEQTTITHNGVSYNVYIGKYTITSTGFTYKLSF